MKREGRQHGVVNCYHIFDQESLSQQRFVKMVDSASTMGLFAKVPTKPTNQSKYTGKCQRSRCNRCHIHPVCKSKDKAKGTMKIRSLGAENEFAKYSFGTSATGVLAYLADDGAYDNEDYDYDYDYDYDDRVEETYDHDYGYGYDDDNYILNDDDDATNDLGFDMEISADDVDVTETDDDDDDDDDDAMSFCDVGLCWGHEDGDEYGDDGWYLVGGQMQ
ncbi:uncharacterized protein [Rutidosis leptorrhynchoides]|uniref:uncharacterized protein n=1 Tax=Rutidosis leptorrhynchoides TaxID=125765 RepID=UPI003A9A0933